jgi:hypothetical protein
VNLLLFFLFIFGLFEKILPGSRDLLLGYWDFLWGLDDKRFFEPEN